MPGHPIAVVIPCFNDGATLRETLASIDEPEEIELVVVNDGSDDPETLSVLAELETAGTRVLHQENRGLAAAGWQGSPRRPRRTCPPSTRTTSRRPAR